jgi:hypothetical protein
MGLLLALRQSPQVFLVIAKRAASGSCANYPRAYSLVFLFQELSCPNQLLSWPLSLDLPTPLPLLGAWCVRCYPLSAVHHARVQSQGQPAWSASGNNTGRLHVDHGASVSQAADGPHNRSRRAVTPSAAMRASLNLDSSVLASEVLIALHNTAILPLGNRNVGRSLG